MDRVGIGTYCLQLLKTSFSYTQMHGLDSESWRVVAWSNKWNLGLYGVDVHTDTQTLNNCWQLWRQRRHMHCWGFVTHSQKPPL